VPASQMRKALCTRAADPRRVRAVAGRVGWPLTHPTVKQEASTKAYLVITGSLFGLAGIVHLFGLLREFMTEGANHVLGNPHFLVTSSVIVTVGGGFRCVGTCAATQGPRPLGLLTSKTEEC
jgi:hypothetical protein